jgi:8-oxo-dGTP pyrophosphatase MutT (NUDIX family)
MAAWINRGERTVYESPWFRLNKADVELPDGRHLDHYLLRQRPVVLTACVDAHDRVLMLWRHRFIPDTYGYELPSGVVDPGEDLEAAAARETLEETGWRPGPLKHLLTVEPSAGFSDAVHHAYYADTAHQVGAPEDAIESDRIDWVPLADVPTLITEGKIRAANTVAALLQLRSLRPPIR